MPLMDNPVKSADGVQQIEFRAMGSHMLAAVESDDPAVGLLLAEVPGWFAGWEQALSRFRESSELSVLNRAGSSAPMHVSETLWEVLQLALNAKEYTEGLVTPAVLNALEAAGYTTSFDSMKQDGANASAVTAGTVSSGAGPVSPVKIELDPSTRSVSLPAGVRLDFGGIAKGWAADQAVSRLAPYGAALVNAGGDIAVGGLVFQAGGWPIGVDAPFEPGAESDDADDNLLELLCIKSGGVATSGRDYRKWQQGGTWRHHIIDPRTGAPSETDVVSATIIGPTARAAEISAKAVMLLGSTDGLAWLEDRPTLAGMVILENGQVLQSARFRKYIWSNVNGN